MVLGQYASPVNTSIYTEAAWQARQQQFAMSTGKQDWSYRENKQKINSTHLMEKVLP
jgi:hypothetical protein